MKFSINAGLSKMVRLGRVESFSCPADQIRCLAFAQIKPAKTNLPLFGRFLPWERYHTGNV